MDYNIYELIESAYKAQSYSYSPYSNFRVGAALLCENNKIYLGCNIENASFTPTNCAERTAFFKAISEGEKHFKTIAIVGNSINIEKACNYCAPCGVCRQVMAEFCKPEIFEIILCRNKKDFKKYFLKELLPLSFTKSELE